MREGSPRLAHLRGLCGWAHWDILAMCRALEQAAAGFARQGDAASAQRSQALIVLGLAAGGLANDAIAVAMGLSPRTIERHLSNAYSKLGLVGKPARAAAVAEVFRQGLA